MTRLKGGPELLAFLEAFPAKLQKGALKSAMIAGARVVRDEARANVPSKSGLLRKAIKTSSPRAFTGGAASVKVKLLGKHSHLGHWMEYGVAPHFIAAGSSDMSARRLTKAAMRGDLVGDVATQSLKINGQFVTGAVLHPGFAAKPFLRPALDRKQVEVINAIGERLREYLKNKTGFTAPVTLTADVEE